MSSISLKFHETLVAREDDEEKKISEDLVNYKLQLALFSCTNYLHGVGYIDSRIHPKKVDFMFRKKIKLFICNLNFEAFLVTEDGEKHYWSPPDKNTFASLVNEFANFHLNEDENVDDVEEEIVDMNFRTKNEYENEYEHNSFYIHYYPHKFDWSHTRIVKTATDTLNFLALTDDGKIYFKNICGERVFQGIYQMNIKEKIICFACGCNFYVMATDNGKIYTWGVNFDGQLGISITTKEYIATACEVIELSGKTIVKVVCGEEHTIVLTDEGKVYSWGGNDYGQSDFNSRDNVLSPIMVNISNVKKISDIAAMGHISAVKSIEDGLFYIWGFLIFTIGKPITCEYTNIFDICNSMTAQSPISNMESIYTDEEWSILNDLEVAFDDRLTSDLTIEVEEQLIYVHKVILKIRSSYFRSMFQSNNWIEDNKSVITLYDSSYVICKTILKYFYTNTINLSSLCDKLELLKLADKYGEINLISDCIRIIKTEVTVSNVFHINKIAQDHNIKELEEYCFSFYLKNMESVECTEGFTQLDVETKFRLAVKVKKFFQC